ncbi:MAG: methyltransferase domain-containing protein [Geminicoccaceae bacterium]
MNTAEEFLHILACPYCQGRLAVDANPARCLNIKCGASFGRSQAGQLDLRLSRPKTVSRSTIIGGETRPPIPLRRGRQLEPLPRAGRLLDHLPRARHDRSLMLDVGCGSLPFRDLFARCGFQQIGIDIAGIDASLHADARALPFCDASFEFVWSNAVLQYVPHPDIALAEIHRVLQPGGLFLGSVGFLEAFDGYTMHPLTWLGAHQCFAEAGFEIERVMPNAVWTGPVALTRAMFPRLPTCIADVMARAVDGLSALYWRLGTLRHDHLDATDRLRKITGGLDFVLRKPLSCRKAS